MATAGGASTPVARGWVHWTVPVDGSNPTTVDRPLATAIPGPTATEDRARSRPGAATVHRSENGGGTGVPETVPRCAGPPWSPGHPSISCPSAVAGSRAHIPRTAATTTPRAHRG